MQPATSGLQEIFKNLDLSSMSQEITWSLNAPKCLCEPCFTAWLDWGKRVCKDDDGFYEERVKKEKFHRRQRKIAKQIDERSRKN